MSRAAPGESKPGGAGRILHPIVEAIDQLEDEETYRDIGAASIHDTAEALIQAKAPLRVLESQPRLAAQLLIARLRERPIRSPDLPRIGLLVALGRLGQRDALPALASYLSDLPDEARSEAGHIDHPFRYALRALERIEGQSLGLGPGEDLNSLFERRHQIVQRLLGRRMESEE